MQVFIIICTLIIYEYTFNDIHDTTQLFIKHYDLKSQDIDGETYLAKIALAFCLMRMRPRQL